MNHGELRQDTSPFPVPETRKLDEFVGVTRPLRGMVFNISNGKAPGEMRTFSRGNGKEGKGADERYLAMARTSAGLLRQWTHHSESGKQTTVRSSSNSG